MLEAQQASPGQRLALELLVCRLLSLGIRVPRIERPMAVSHRQPARAAPRLAYRDWQLPRARLRPAAGGRRILVPYSLRAFNASLYSLASFTGGISKL